MAAENLKGRFLPGDVVYRAAGSGFVGEDGWALITEDGWQPCFGMLQACNDPDCREWNTLQGLPGKTRAEAEEAARRRDFLGAACHVSDCELSREPPED